MAGLEIRNAKLLRTGEGSVMQFEVPREAHNETWQYLNAVGKQTNDYFCLTVGKPRRTISKGYRSQLSRHWGHCEDIAEQLTTATRRYTKDRVDRALRNMAVREGLPTEYNDIDDTVEPKGLSGMSVEEYEILERVKQRFADSIPLWLSEYDDECHACGGKKRVPANMMEGTVVLEYIDCSICNGTGKSAAPVSYRSVQGRTRKEMVEYWREKGGNG